ncbi:MAG: L-seryl-tRNA(Sec) selenium transferase [Synergistaceae bacterium]|nr:L-seryl-tRNA(Sec) selenium transferase [Synergistaceae bacterium]
MTANFAKKNSLRSIPAMDLLLAMPEVEPYVNDQGREAVKKALGEAVERLRKRVLAGEDLSPSAESVFQIALPVLTERSLGSLRPVVNGTGVVIHTNLGRSCLAPGAIDAVRSAAGRYSTLEYDLSGGARGHRSDHVEWLIKEAAEAEGALVVNNNAGAVLLMLAGLCSGREVVVSRGELVEIGGSFRIPDIMAFSGAKLAEVGATNRTHLKDYRGAITENTAALLKVHPSNFRMEGFTASVSREELAGLAREKGLLFLEDLGSGALADLGSLGLRGEPTVARCLAEGVDLVSFSGDKMLGGPQIGVLAGKKKLVDQLENYPLLRALRVDKMTLAAFEATLRLYLSGKSGEIPTLAMLGQPGEALKKRALRLAARLKKILPPKSVSAVEADDAVGGGAFPAERLPGWAVAVAPPEGKSAGALLAELRNRPVPVIAGARGNMALIHVRTLLDGDDRLICDAFAAISGRE